MIEKKQNNINVTTEVLNAAANHGCGGEVIDFSKPITSNSPSHTSLKRLENLREEISSRELPEELKNGLLADLSSAEYLLVSGDETEALNLLSSVARRLEAWRIENSNLNDTIISPSGETQRGDVPRVTMYRCQHADDFGIGCRKLFRSLESLTLHTRLKHKKRVHFDTVIVDANYIHARLIKCQTERIHFKHRDDVPRFITTDEDPYTPVEQCGHDVEFLNSCNLRNCPKCESVRRMRYERKFRHGVRLFKRASVLTVTHKTFMPLDRSSKKGLEKQTRNFMKRIQRRCKGYTVRYIRVLEVVRKDTGYYYHYHYLIDMPYVRQESISKMWASSTDGSFVVWIESLKDANGNPIGMKWNRMKESNRSRNALNYVSKYLSKPMSYDISHEDYSKYVYGTHFLESRNLTCIKGHNSSISVGLKCPKCKERMVYGDSEALTTEEIINLSVGLDGLVDQSPQKLEAELCQ